MSDARPPAAPDERDAWLHQALRHAPDAAAVPPNALREAILAEARSAVQAQRRSAARPSLVDHAAAFWSWLARPPVAAGFASVMAATLVGLMWWDRPMDETVPPPPPSSRIVAPKATPLPPAASIGPDAPLSPRAAPVPKTAPAAAATTEQRKDQLPLNARQAAPSPSPFPGNGPSENAAAARDRATAPILAKKAGSETMAAAPEPQRSAATEPPAPVLAETARRSDGANDAKSAGALAALAKPASPPRQRAATAPRDAADALDAGAAAAPQAFAAAPAPVREAAKSEPRATAVPAAQPMATLLGSIARGAERWSRSAPSGEAAVIDATTQAWLASVDAATAGRWQVIMESTTRLEGALATETNALPLSRDGRIAAIVRVEDGGVFFQLQPGPAWFAPLAPDAVARLRATLPPLAR